MRMHLLSSKAKASSHRILCGAAFAIASLASTRDAHAESPDSALAETLFQQAKVLVAKGDYDAACPKLAESQRIDPGDGTLLALAVCHESQGKLALAWSEYTMIVNKKATVRPDRVRRARESLSAIEPKLVHVSIVVPETTRRSAARGTSTTSTLEVLRDGVVLDESAWGTAIPTEAGAHVIEARAPGKKTIRIDAVAGLGGKIEVVIPALTDADAPLASTGAATPVTATTSSIAIVDASSSPSTSSSSRSAEQHSSGRAMRITAISLGAAGVVALGVGAYFGLRAVSLSDQAKVACGHATTSCSDASLATNNDAKSAAQISNIMIASGALTAASGAVLYLIAPKSPVTPYANPQGAGVAIQAHF